MNKSYRYRSIRDFAHDIATEPSELNTLNGENIVCFAKDWSEAPTSNNHVMRQMARTNRVLWLNSIATRTPSLSSGRDIRKIGRKLASFLQAPRRVEENLWVYTPLVLPFPHSRLATTLNRWILRMTIGVLRRILGMRDFQLWTFLPNTGEYVGTLGESLSVYYCVDEWAGFTNIDGPKMEAAERLTCERADIVFATARTLVEKKRPLNPETHLAAHGVDYELFASALSPSTTVPADVAALPPPVLGVCGTIQDWIDLELLAYLAERHPEWSLALVGPVLTDVSCLTRYPNVHLLGRKPHDALPACCKGFAVGLIPYRLTERMRYVNPLKMREYVAAGLPVVSTDVPEVRYYSDCVTVAHSREEFEQGIVQALQADSVQLRVQRSQRMRSQTWERKVAELTAQIMRVKGNRCQRKPDTVPGLSGRAT